MKVHKEIGSKERFMEMFKNVNKTNINEGKEEKKIIEEGYNKWGQKKTKTRLDEAYGEYSPDEFTKDDAKGRASDMDAVMATESFDNQAKEDEEYLDKTYDNVQNGKLDGGMSDYPVDGVKPETKAPSLKGLKGDRIPLTVEAVIELPPEESEVEVEPEVEDQEFAPDAMFADAEPELDAEMGGEEIPAPSGEYGSEVIGDPNAGTGEFGGEDQIDGGMGDESSPADFDNQQVLKGMEVELEHSDDPKIALEIAMDHLTEIPDYYDHLADMEAQAQGAEGGATEPEAIEVMGDAPIEEPAGEPSEDEVLWGRMDAMGDEPEDEVDSYEPKGFGEGYYDDKIGAGEYDSNVEEIPDSGPLPDEIVDDPDRNMDDLEKGERDYDQARIARKKQLNTNSPTGRYTQPSTMR